MKRRQAHAGQYGLFDDTNQLRSEEADVALPETAQRLAAVIGLQATIDLVKSPQGGNDFVVPSVVGGGSAMWAILVDAIGEAAAAKLVEYFHGTRIYVPKCEEALLAYRNREIVRRYTQGEPLESLRQEHRMTRRHMLRIFKQPV